MKFTSNLNLTRGMGILIILAAIAGAISARAADDPPPPQPLPSTGNCYNDNIYYGAIPPGGETSPVLVFVHGLSGLAEDWFSANTSAGFNDMYYQAYWAGYRTAFVNLNVDPEALGCAVERRPAEDVFDNGDVLGLQLDTITTFYEVEKVDIISHSKGGIDAQAAIIWSEAWPMVRNLFTLSTPHQGSILVDQLWSPEGFWLSILLGQRDQATYSLQTAFMQLFRQIADPSDRDDDVHYYSAAGNYWQTPETIFEVTGEWLQNQPEGGDNDGVVTVSSTYLQDAMTLFLQPWNHNQVYQGYNAFPFIQNILNVPEIIPNKIYLPLLVHLAEASNAIKLASLSESNSILRGGLVATTTTDQLPIESQTTNAVFQFITNHPALTGELVSPNGVTYPLAMVQKLESTVFEGSYLFEVTVDHPVPGQWMYSLQSETSAAYFLIVNIESPLQIGLSGLPNRPVESGLPIELSVHANAGSWITSIIASTDLTTTSLIANPISESRVNFIFSEEGIYSISIKIAGFMEDGTAFERTFTHSQAVINTEQNTNLVNLLADYANRIDPNAFLSHFSEVPTQE